MTQVRRLKGVNRIGGVIGRYGPNGDSGVWPVHARASDPYYDQVQLLLHMDGTDGSTSFSDSSKNKFTVTAIGDAQVDNGRTQFGESLLLDGSGDALQVPHSTSLSIGSGDFCIEAWIYATSTTGTRTIIQKGFPPTAAPINSAEYAFRIVNNALTLATSARGNATFVTTSGGTVPLNQWVHVAASRLGDVRKLFINGAEVASQASASAFLGTADVRVGLNVNASLPFVGSIDELRFTVGSPRYLAGGFTPPARAFLP